MADPNDDAIWNTITEAVTELLKNEGRAGAALTPQTSLNRDLEISSLDLVHLLLALEEKMGQSFPFESIALINGQYRDDLTLGELHDFMMKNDETVPETSSLPGTSQPN